MEVERIVDWSELCSEILLEIADRLGTRTNVYNFREVCKSWRFPLSYIPQRLPQISPLLPHRFFARDSDFFSSLSLGTLHHLLADGVYLLRPKRNPESAKPWLVTVEEFYPGKVSVRLPLSKIRASQYFLPKKEKFSKTLNLLDFDVTEIARGYSIRAPATSLRLPAANGGLMCKTKVVLFANPNAFEPLSINDYTALVWFDHGRVAWVRLGRPLDWGWLAYNGTPKSDEDDSLMVWKFDDIVDFKGRAYAVDGMGKIYAVYYDLEWGKGENFQQTLRMECILNDSISCGCDSYRRRSRLVVDSCGVLYVVEKDDTFGGEVHFNVYKLNEESFKWNKVSGLGGDRMLFVSADWCFFASAADFPGCEGNCIIYFKDSFPITHPPTYDDSDHIIPLQPVSGSGGCKNSNFVVFRFDDGKAEALSDFPQYAELLWPPPAWFSPKVAKFNPVYTTDHIDICCGSSLTL